MKNAHLKTLRQHPAYPEALKNWDQAHRTAVAHPTVGFESALVEMLTGWLRYADATAVHFDNGIGSDYVLGPCWAQIGDGLRGLLNGDIGRMDAGTLDGILCNALETERFDLDTL